ncbi:MAG: hypothetical protein QOJ81_2219 [Chloroflexota bacterium]|jgi:hypothetical protein|nr:hypothetical protein [Chloroflexota bacterium]
MKIPNLATAAASALRSDAPFGASERGRSVPCLI